MEGRRPLRLGHDFETRTWTRVRPVPQLNSYHTPKPLRRKEMWFTAALSLAATYFFFAEYLPPFKSVHLWSDIAGFHYPLHLYAFHSLKQGQWPEWDPSMYCGIPFIGNVQAAFLYPVTWLMYVVSWNEPRFPFKVMEAFAFLHVWLGFLLCYVWLRGRAAKLPSALGGLVFACSGYMLYQLPHPGVFGAMAWMPLSFLGVDEAARLQQWRPLWKVSAASALAFLAGYPAAWIVTCAVIVFYAFGARPVWTVPRVCAALAASPLLFLAQLLPAMEARSQMVLEPKYGPGAYGWKDLLLSFCFPNWLDFNPGHPTTYEPGCMYLYLGLPALFGMVWAVWRRKWSPYVQPFLIAAAAFALANPPGWLIGLVNRTPVLNTTMQPFNFYAAVAPMAALITAISLHDFLRERRARKARPGWLAAAAMAALLIWPARQLLVWAQGGDFATRWQSAAETALALAIFAAGLWSASNRTGRWRVALTAGVLLLALVDYRVYGSGRWFNAAQGDVDDEQPLYGIGGLDDDAYRAIWASRHFRVVTAESQGPPPTDYRRWGLATPEGFDPFLSRQYVQVIERWVLFHTNRLFHTDLSRDDMLQALGVRFVVARKDSEPDVKLASDPRFRRLGREDVFAHAYEYLYATPPFRWEGPNSTATVQLLKWDPGRREFEVQAKQSGRLVLVEQFYPGWKAAVDGVPVQIQRADGAFQSVPVGPGGHRVVYEYESAGFRIGAAASLLSWLGVGLAALARAAGGRRTRNAWEPPRQSSGD